MRKLVVLYILVFVITGCAGSRRGIKSGGMRNTAVSSISYNDVYNQNLSEKSFFIGKADVELNSRGQTQKFVASIKYEKPGRYLVSIRSRTGIEAGRIYIDRDTLLANDRINRVLYYGKPGALSMKYGIFFDMIPVIFGDFISDNRNTVSKMCDNGSFEVEESVRGSRMIYEIDCGRKKLSLAENLGSYNTLISALEYESFINTDGISVPSQVKINHVISGTSVTLSFDKIERPWDGVIDFIPGNRYERIELK